MPELTIVHIILNFFPGEPPLSPACHFVHIIISSLAMPLSCSNARYKISPWLPVKKVEGYPITRRQILDSSKLEEFADNNFKFDENDRKLSKREENTVGKGEIACYEQFLLFPQCFQKACFPGASKGVMGMG